MLTTICLLLLECYSLEESELCLSNIIVVQDCLDLERSKALRVDEILMDDFVEVVRKKEVWYLRRLLTTYVLS